MSKNGAEGLGVGTQSFCPSVRYDVGILSFCFSVRGGVGFYLPSLGEGLGVGVRFTPRRGIDMPAPGNARGERMLLGYAPEGGKRIAAHHYRVAKGVSEIIILLPILGECWLRTIPKALPWADLFWPFFLHFVLKASKLERRPYLPQPSTLSSLGEGLGVM